MGEEFGPALRVIWCEYVKAWRNVDTGYFVDSVPDLIMFAKRDLDFTIDHLNHFSNRYQAKTFSPASDLEFLKRIVDELTKEKLRLENELSSLTNQTQSWQNAVDAGEAWQRARDSIKDDARAQSETMGASS